MHKTLFFILCLGFCCNAQAVESCQLAGYQAGERPTQSQPTEVNVGLLIADILEISDLAQNITMDGVLFARWQDQRLVEFAGCRFPLEALWHPELQIINSGNTSRRQAFELNITDDGWVEGRFRVFGSLASPRHMTDFPFDSHELSLDFASMRYSAEEVLFTVNQSGMRQRADFTVADWQVGQAIASTQVTDLPIASSAKSILRVTIPIQRMSRYFVYKIIFPLIMIVMMSWAVFWVDPNSLGSQMALASTTMLTLITFQFTMNDLLPRIGYLTQLDQFILSSSALVFLALLESVCTGFLASKGKANTAKSLDRISRVGFPLVFGAVILITLVL